MQKLEKAIRAMTDKYDWGDRVDGFVKEIIDICMHYSEKLGYDPLEIFTALESRRDYSYPNYYQWANFPKLDNVTIFKNKQEMRNIIKPQDGFRCPVCKGVSKDPYECDTNIKVSGNKPCDWKSYGLLRTLGLGLRFLILEDWIEKPIVDECFMPIAMEQSQNENQKAN